MTGEWRSSEWIELCLSLLDALPVKALQKRQEFLWISKDRTGNTVMWRSQSTSDGVGMLTRGVSWGNANIQRNGQKSENWKTSLTANCPHSTPTKWNLLGWDDPPWKQADSVQRFRNDSFIQHCPKNFLSWMNIPYLCYLIVNSNSHVMLLSVWTVASTKENFKLNFNSYI